MEMLKNTGKQGVSALWLFHVLQRFLHFVMGFLRRSLQEPSWIQTESARTTGREYIAHYHGERHHQGLNNRLIDPREHVGQPDGDVECHERLGGLLRYYYHRTAA